MCNSQVNQLSQSVLGEAVFPNFRQPSQFTGEHFGVRYLYNQTGRNFTATADQLDTQIDEGFGDVDELEESSSVVTTMDQDEHLVTVAPPADLESDEDEVIIVAYSIISYHKLITCMLWFVMIIQRAHVQQDEAVENVDDEAVVYRGIPGWEKVDRLAKVLLDLKGLCVTNAQA